jgi:hypothetical protein
MALAQAVFRRLPAASNEKAIEYFSKAIVLQSFGTWAAYLALGEKQRAREQFNKGLSLPSTEKDDENSKQRARASLKQLQ